MKIDADPPRDPDFDRRRKLSTFLALSRCKLDPALTMLGEYVRDRDAIGNIVTPREIADAAGINPRWYEFAERGEPVRPSGAALYALADVFRLSPRERAVLVNLANPSLARDSARSDSLELLDAFTSLRGYLRKLQACSSMDEVLSIVQDTAASFFPEVSYLTMTSRLSEGGWSQHAGAIGAASRVRAFAHMQEEIVNPIFALDPVAADVITCFPLVSAPGDAITYRYDELRLARILGKSYADFKRLHQPMRVAVMRSRDDFIGHLYLGDFGRFYDGETDRALASALVDFASLVSTP